jgi:aspartyl-tRNA(Asn)/glutamyl-tRNA(Gln) amidotransferase subunit B
MADYIPTIGIETHVQLNSKTKLFAAVGNDAREAQPNSLISHICVGLPGALPVLNEGALRLAAKAAFALGTKPQKFSHFDRKHYFYPDLPKGYQITQYKNPIILGGQVEIVVDGQKKSIKITRAHLEEDAGKTTHPEGADYSLVDLNRAGTPLLEIVSEPEIHSAAEAKAYVRELYLLMKYAQVSNVDLYHGNMRFDVNVSLSAKEGEFGTRAEVKNLNSFRSVEAAVEYEIKRQTALLESGGEVIQETRGWDEAKQKTTAQRGKEEAHDYRYFPDPDLPPVELSEEMIEEIKASVAELPPSIRTRLSVIDISEQVVEDLLDNPEYIPDLLLVLDKAGPAHARRVAFWQLENGAATAENDMELSEMVALNKVSSSAAKTIREEVSKSGESPAAAAERLNLLQMSDEGELEQAVKKVIESNPKAAEDIKSGEMKAIGFLVGLVMKETAGKANPGIVQNLIKKQLGV